MIITFLNVCSSTNLKKDECKKRTFFNYEQIELKITSLSTNVHSLHNYNRFDLFIVLLLLRFFFVFPKFYLSLTNRSKSVKVVLIEKCLC